MWTAWRVSRPPRCRVTDRRHADAERARCAHAATKFHPHFHRTIEFDARLSGVRFDGRPAAGAHDRSPAAVPPTVRSHSLSPGQLCELLGVSSRAAARVAGLLYPDVGAIEGAATFEALDGDEARDALRATVFRACPPDGMFRIDAADAIASTDALTAEVARRVPGFRCRLGPDAYRGGAGWLRSLRAERCSTAACRLPARRAASRRKS